MANVISDISVIWSKSNIFWIIFANCALKNWKKITKNISNDKKKCENRKFVLSMSFMPLYDNHIQTMKIIRIIIIILSR